MQLFSAENFRFLLIYISMEKFKKKFGLCIFRALDLMIAKNVLLECFVASGYSFILAKIEENM